MKILPVVLTACMERQRPISLTDQPLQVRASSAERMANPDSSLLVGDEPLCPAAAAQPSPSRQDDRQYPAVGLGQDETKWHAVGIEDTLTLQCTSWNGLSNEV